MVMEILCSNHTLYAVLYMTCLEHFASTLNIYKQFHMYRNGNEYNFILD